MLNFDYLKEIDLLQDLYGFCNAAELNQVSNPEQSAINSRRALEWITRVIYLAHDEDIPERATLFELVDGELFKNFINNPDLMKAVHYVRKVGNMSAHTGKVSRSESFFSLLNIHNLVGSVLVKLNVIDEFPAFDKNLIPNKPQIHLEPTQEPQPSSSFVGTIDVSKIDTTPVPTPRTDLTEEETRKLYIDVMLKEAGWDVLETEGSILSGKACIEVEVQGMPSDSGIGYADYVLFGEDGKPLAVIEAKRTSKDPSEGKHQAELYAQCLEQRYGVKPVIYYTNGFETYVMDGIYPQRQLYSFHSQNDLKRLIERRNRKDITDMKVNPKITDRGYQKQAITAVCEHLNSKHRRALIVMATGTGKTRVSISLVDVLSKNDWVKNVLFLADRTSLVNQAHKNFVKLLPNMTTCVLNEGDNKNKDKSARIMFSTYQTMINYIDADDKEFSVGRFDLIIIDEAHRSVFGKYGAIFDYFDSLLIGLTATPREEIDKNTYELLNLEDGIPNFAYEYEQAVEDGFLVPYMGLKRGSKILRGGIRYDDLSDDEKQELEKVWEWERVRKALATTEEAARDVEGSEIFRYIYNIDTINQVLEDLMTNGLKVQGGERIGKTIIFAYNHKHAEMIVKQFGLLYPEYGSDFCVLIDNYVNYSQDLINKFEVRDGDPQIAVSVDMLDTGIDVPDVLNLVFFKIVKSKIKFNQMIGRGTRLSEGIFGVGEDKKEFYIFDWCQNFEYFGTDIKQPAGTKQISLTEKLFRLKTEIAYELQTAEHQAVEFDKHLHDELKEQLVKQVGKLNESHISVREHLAAVAKFKQPKHWVYISPVDADCLKNEIAPLLPHSTADEGAKRFDILALTVEMSLLVEGADASDCVANIAAIASKLEEKASIPQVMARMATIKEVQTQVFWDNATLSNMERIRKELRDLIKFLVGEKEKVFTVDIKDETFDDGIASGFTAQMTYKQRVIDFLAQNRDLPVIQKIFAIEPLDQADIRELERILWEELGSKEEYEQNARNISVGVFIRANIGVDRDIALRHFSQFINNASLNSEQEEWLNTIISYVCKNGDIDTNIMVNEFPFAGVGWQNIYGENAIGLVKFVNEIHKAVIA
ncbi:MAG: DEAD/DEAH box helicase family protein [Bacteroidales bacterium]|nr:DEAD/DEAH box helicase family protein [Bacteroidales bacterium]